MSDPTLLTVPPPTLPSGANNKRPFILVPLYIYPLPAAWDPLYTAAALHADSIDFYVVVNPDNGPGKTPLPDANYVAALERLTALGNVRVIGYVHCSYGLREAEEIVRDVERFAAWEGESVRAGGEKIVVDGIFIDETPSSTEYVKYLAAIANAAKMILNRNVLPPIPDIDVAKANNDDGVNTTAAPETPAADTTNATPPLQPPNPSGFLTPSLSSAIVIYNPGVVVDPIFYQAADYVVAFENSCAQWWTHPASLGQATAARKLPRALLARSIPIAHSAGGEEAVARLSRRAGEMGCLGLYVTCQPGYTAWCEGWDGFVGEVARRTAAAGAE